VIRINLVPAEELENPLRWVPDVAVLVLIAAVGWVVAESQLARKREQIVEITASRNSFEASYAKLEPDLQRFSNLERNKAELSSKVAALQAIAVTNLTRLRPILVLEHLLNLRPEGVWFSSVLLPTSGNSVAIQGHAFDHLLVSEFAATLKATASQTVDPADLRTQVWFPDVRLLNSTLGGDGAAADLGEISNFRMDLQYAERAAGLGGTRAVSGVQSWQESTTAMFDTRLDSSIAGQNDQRKF